MDTYKDAVALNDLWASGQAPWRLWGHDAETRTRCRRARSRGSWRDSSPASAAMRR